MLLVVALVGSGGCSQYICKLSLVTIKKIERKYQELKRSSAQESMVVEIMKLSDKKVTVWQQLSRDLLRVG